MILVGVSATTGNNLLSPYWSGTRPLRTGNLAQLCVNFVIAKGGHGFTDPVTTTRARWRPARPSVVEPVRSCCASKLAIRRSVGR